MTHNVFWALPAAWWSKCED